MHRYIYHYICISVSVLYIACLPQPARAGAWLQDHGALQLNFSRLQSSLEIYDPNTGLPIPYGRREIEFYTEYGFKPNISLTGKFITGRNGTGLPSEQERVQIGEAGFRINAAWAQTKLLPPGTQKIWQYFSDDKKVQREYRAAFETGFNFNGQRRDRLGWRSSLAIADKIEAGSVNPLYLYTEINSEVILWPNSDSHIKLISRIELGHRGWYVAYERADGWLRSFYNYNEHLWFGEIGIPLAGAHHLQLQWGHDRTRYGVPRENRFNVGLRFRFPP